MGREIRMVIPNWEHPKKEKFDHLNREYTEEYIPMYNRSYREAVKEWKEGFAKWESGEDEDREEYKEDDGTPYEYWDWNGGPPDKEYYRPDWDENDMTWFQVYQTVSEGSPVTPPFATKEELAKYLSEHGDFWEQDRAEKDNRPRNLMTLEQAMKFVDVGWVPSMTMRPTSQGNEIKSNYETIEESK